MQWVEFTGPFDWDPPERKGRTTFRFETGQRRFLRALCAGDAIAAGSAKEIAKPETVEPDMVSLHPLLGPMDGDEPRTAVPLTPDAETE